MKKENHFVSIEDVVDRGEGKCNYLIENTNDILYVLDAKGIILYISPHMKNYGFNPEDIQGTHFANYIYPDDCNKLIDNFQEMGSTRRAFNTKLRIVDNEDKHCWFENQSCFQSNADGSSSVIIGALREIPDHKATGRDLQECHTQSEELVNVPTADLAKANEKLKMEIEEMSEIEASLKKEKSRIDSILRVASIGVGTIVDRKILEANDEIYRIVGYERSELVGKDVSMLYVSDDDLEKAGREIYNNLKGESISNIEQKLKRKDGQIIDVLMSFTPMDPNDLSKGYTFSIQDITEKLLAERTVEEKKERHIRSIFQATPTGIGVTWDRKLIDVNDKMCQIVGRSKEELVGASTRILYPTSEEYERVGKELEVIVDKKEPGDVESHWVNKDGSIRDVYMTFALIDVDDPSTGLTFTVQDVTERKLAEEEIYKLNQFQQTIIESADVWINVFNKNGELVVWNNAAESISGYSKEEMLGNTRIYEMLCPDETEFKEVAGAKKAIFGEGKRISDLETSITRKDGGKRIISWNSRELFDEEKNVVGSIVIGNDITKQKEAEKMEKQQVHFMQELIDAIPAPIFYKDTDNIYLGCNNAFAEFTGIPKEDLIGKGVYELYEKDIANKYRKMNMDLLKKGGSQTYEYYLQSSSGQKRAVIFNNSIFTDIDGNTAGQIGVVFDITERKVAEEALKKHSHFMQELLETIPAPVYYKDKEGSYLGCNRAFENFSGKKCEDLIGNMAYDVYDEKQAAEYTRMDQKLVETGGMQSYESEVVYAGDNTKHNVLFNKSVFTDMNGDIGGIIGVILDITAHLRSEEEKKKKERHIRSIFQATPTGIGVTWDRKLLDVNDKMCQIVGRSKEELVGASTRILYPTPEEYERVGKELKLLIDKKEPGVIESRWVNKDGNIRDVYMTFALIDVDDPSTGLTFTVQDVTERKLAEEKIYKLNQFQQTVIESADVWINVSNKDGEVVVWNNAAESISGYSKEEMLGNTRI
ncbi:PAS domain S-box protein [Methanococcoides methylutens]|uniref:PAS domain S-box protein n=1 Tax=Methanococcoides methylutens TaxID=2226 RepID=UPI0040445648